MTGRTKMNTRNATKTSATGSSRPGLILRVRAATRAWATRLGAAMAVGPSPGAKIDAAGRIAGHPRRVNVGTLHNWRGTRSTGGIGGTGHELPLGDDAVVLQDSQ